MRRYFAIIILSITSLSCELDSVDVVDTTSVIPILEQATVAPGFVNTSGYPQSQKTIDTTVLITARLDKVYSHDVTVYYSIEDPDRSILSSGVLSDDGKVPDQTSSDGTYTAEPNVRFPVALLGTYTVKTYASNNVGERSVLISSTVILFNSSNTPPQLSLLDAPDTVVVPSGSNPSLVKISITAADSQGLSDIVSVTLRSLRPDSTVAGLFPLYDDGSSTVRPTFGIVSGDSVANDGRYTLTIPISGTTQRNTYRDFIFTAADRSSTISNAIIKRVYIQ